MRQAGLFGLPDHLRKLSSTGDPLEALAKVVDFEIFREALETALDYSDGSKGGCPAYDPVAMFKVLILAAQHTVSDERMEFLIRDRLSWLRFLGFDLGAPTPDRNTIWTFRERLIRAGAMDDLFATFDRELRRSGYLAMGGQIVDATLVSAPKQRRPMPANRRSAHASSMSSPTKRIAWACSSAPSGSSGPRPRSASPTSLTTSSAWNALDGVVGSHRAIRTGSGRQAARMAPFKWVNTTLGNIKSAITGTYRKLGPDHAQRYLASFAWRYNRRYQLNTMIPRFVHSAARTQPIPYRALIAG